MIFFIKKFLEKNAPFCDIFINFTRSVLEIHIYVFINSNVN